MVKVSNANRTVIIILLLTSPLVSICGCDSTATSQQSDAVISDRGVGKNIEAQAIRIISEALANNDPRIRTSAIETAAATNSRQFMPEIQRLLRDEFVPVRFAAAVAIGDARYSAARGDAAQLLKDTDESVRIAAGYAIYKLGDKSGLELIRKSITSRDQRVRANAAFLLGKSGDKRAIPLLYEAMRGESSDDRVRLNSMDSIARLGDENIYHKIWAMLISAYADDRVLGIRAMGALGTSQARDSILTMLKDDLIEVRLVAAEQLGKLGDTSGEGIVLNALTQGVSGAADREERERIETLASLAIGQIRTPELKKFLPELLKNESQFVRLAAAKSAIQCAGRDIIGQ